ncbi:ATP-binding cassette domain-containing protein [Cuniculiplasma sp. SKW4]|uniref:ATP-binding cassette domain-containing protein n=1 Tax=Cuniculiplasma sp. SKW4 TaxID=3400171 RepID=UPI003FCF0E39
MPLIDISGIKINYANNNMLNNLKISINEGITVIIGQNGVGKSSLISVVEGLTRINDRNGVKVMGLSPYMEPERAFSEVAFLPEKPIGIGITVKHWVKYYSYLRKISFETFKELLTLFDIEFTLKRKWKDLSSGELHLLSISLCLSSKAKLFVMDEPNSNLDMVNRMRLSKVLKKMRTEQGASFLITSHLLDEILPISDYVVIANKQSISSPISLREISEENGLLVIRVKDPELIREKMGKMADISTGDNEIILRNSNLIKFISHADRDVLENIVSVHIFPGIMEGFLNERKI